MGISAKIILDSAHPDGPRVTTFALRFHRFIQAEVNTHRSLSKSSGSSRAIPLARTIEAVLTDPAIPVSFPRERAGMQGGAELPIRATAEEHWRNAANEAVEHARRLGDLGVHKSVANRLLEPFLWQTAIVTATDWANFWALRLNPLAQPEFHALANAMKAAYDASTPRPLAFGAWHLPYVTGYDHDEIAGHFAPLFGSRWVRAAQEISAARCARVSYLTHDGQREWRKDLALFHRLKYPGEGAIHAGPLEHVCTPVGQTSQEPGNFGGWQQFRHMVEAELTAERHNGFPPWSVITELDEFERIPMG